MGKLIVFNFITLNGFYKGVNDDTNWHRHGSEESNYSEEMLASDNILLFGRITYEMMAHFWPSKDAIAHWPVVAERMNKSEKIVFSRTLKNAQWSNTKIIKENIIEEINKLKKESTKDLAVLGSGNIVSQLADHHIVDEYQIMIDPIALGKGTPLFNNIKHTLELELIDNRIFKSGVVILSYRPKK